MAWRRAYITIHGKNGNGLGSGRLSCCQYGLPIPSPPEEELATTVIPSAINNCGPQRVDKINFVTHSLGGILVRYYLGHYELPTLGRVVVLSPPNQGSEVVDKLRNLPGFHWFNGPAGGQLGTDDASIPAKLLPVDYEVGVIAGDKTIIFINSMLIPREDDGKVSVKRTQVVGMVDFLILTILTPLS